jgi:hypothetical protein
MMPRAQKCSDLVPNRRRFAGMGRKHDDALDVGKAQGLLQRGIGNENVLDLRGVVGRGHSDHPERLVVDGDVLPDRIDIVAEQPGAGGLSQHRDCSCRGNI